MNKKIERYKLTKDLHEIKVLSKGVLARKVNKAVMETALSELGVECTSLSKTADLKYEELKTQEYLLKMFPAEAKAIFK